MGSAGCNAANVRSAGGAATHENARAFSTAVYPTPFHSRTSAANRLNLWHRWKDYTVPDAYFDVGLEYAALRNACTVFDLSPIDQATHHRAGRACRS